ncbi:MAG: DNA-binding protein [Sphingobacteriia bacterium]|nr:DNA-binding protein [Sphingobacteriia bacterium]
MARTGLTRDQVHEAADSLMLEGQTPTVVGVRTRLGGGSLSNITKWLAEWKAEQEIKRADALPPMPSSVEGAMRQVWGAAWKETQTQIEAEREALANLRKEIERERAEMLAEINRLDGELEVAKTEILQVREALDAERREHESTRADVKEARAIASERKARIEQQAAELQDAQRRAAEATAQAGRAQALVVERDRALADKDRFANDLKREQETARGAKAALDAGAAKIRKLEESLESERQARQTTELAMTELRVQVATLTEKAAHADELRTLLDELRRDHGNTRS